MLIKIFWPKKMQILLLIVWCDLFLSRSWLKDARPVGWRLTPSTLTTKMMRMKMMKILMVSVQSLWMMKILSIISACLRIPIKALLYLSSALAITKWSGYMHIQSKLLSNPDEWRCPSPYSHLMSLSDRILQFRANFFISLFCKLKQILT